MKTLRIALILCFTLSLTAVNAQFPGCPTVDAGVDQTLPCATNCTNLTATPFHAGATNTYTVASIPHAPPIAYNQAGGTVVSAGTDDVWSPIINLPFPFCFYGQTYTTCKVGSNGAIDLGPAAGGGYHPWSYTQDCPNAGLTDDGDIFGVLQDIDPSVCGQIKWYLLGTAPCRIFVVSFNNICHYSCTNLQSRTMMVLYETTNVIDVYVESKPTCGGWNGGHGIIGIQNQTGTAGIAAPGRNTNPGNWTVNTPEGWRFTPNGAPIYTVEWYDGATLLGTGNNINVCPSGTSTTYTAQVTYTRCDGVQIVETDNVSVNYGNLPAPAVATGDETCDGANDGTVSIDNAPGSGPYTVDIAGPSNQQFIEPNTAGGVANFSGLPDGNYTYTVTDAGGCTFTGNFTINPGPTCCTVAAVGTDLLCNGDNSGTVTANPTGSAPFSYSWTNGAGTNQVGTNLPAGSYTVTLTDNIGCTANANVVITEPAALNATNTPTNVSCFGACDGQIDITAPSGGTPPYQYNINAGAFSGASSFPNLCQGSYNVIMEDANNCQFIMAGINVTEPTDLTLAETANTAATCGLSNGSFTVNAGGGTPAYQYDIGGAQQGSPTFNGLASGAYNVTVTDANGCTETIVVNIGNAAGPVPVVDSQTPVTCAGGLNGSVTVSASGGSAPYQFSLDGGPNQASNTFAVTAGPHTITVTDANGCQGTVNFNIGTPTALTYNTVITDATCNGVCDGTITINASNATPPYTYSDDNGLTFQSSNVLTGLCAGNVNVVVQDANGCLANSAEPIAEPSALNSAQVFTEPSCFGMSDGTITFAPAGGTPGYTYSIDNGATFTGANPQTGVSAGLIDVVVQDANGCQYTDQVNVTEPPQFAFNFIANNPSNCGAQDGSFEITASNGLAPYFYSIDGGATVQVNNGFFNNLFSGLYNLVVTDANGCTDSVYSALSDNIMTTQTDAEISTTCYNGCDGVGIVSQTNGAAPFTYTINTGGTQPAPVFAGLCAGQYFITIQDAGQCIGIQEVNIPEPDTIAFTASFVDVTCPGGSDGSINFGPVTGGDTGPYTYSIDGGANFQASPIFNGLAIGTYNLVAMDGNGCLGGGTVTISQPPFWTEFVNSSNLLCNGDNSGFIQVVAGGATGPYTYDLSGTGNATGVFQNLAANNYTITMTDVNGCDTTFDHLITEPAVLTEANVLTHVSCNATCDGEIDVTANGGTAPYQYSSDNGVILQSSNVLQNLCAGNHTLYVEDANGCTVTNNIVITEPTALGMNVVVNPATCGLPNGDITVTGNNGTPGYQYSIDNGATFQGPSLFAGLAPGNYDVVVEDLNGCQYTENHTVLSENSPTIIAVNTTDIDCNGNCNGEIDVQANGGTGVLTYDIGGAGQATGLFQNQCANNYTVTVTDANGCTATQNVAVIEPTVHDHVIAAQQNLNCNGDNSGMIDVDASGGTPVYQYSFDGGATFGLSDVANFLPAGPIDVVSMDANGCQFTTAIVLTEPSPLLIDAQSQTDVNCFDGTDGTADVDVIGGTPPYTYAWTGGTPVAPNDNVTNLAAGGYSVDVTDANGCLVQTVFNITQPPMLVISSVSGVDANCNGVCDGSILINSAQAVQFSIDNGASFQAANTFAGVCGTVAGTTYDIIVENANGCQQATTIDIFEPTPLVLDPIAPIDICYDGFGTLSANATGGVGPYYYIWEATDTTQHYPVQNITTPTNYTCVVTDFNGCTSNAEVGAVGIPFNQFELTTVTPDTANICIGDDVTMSAAGQFGWNNGPYYFHWLNANNDTLDYGSNPFTYTPAGSETVYVVGTDDCDAFDTMEVVINVLPNPVPTFTVDNPNGCSPLTTGLVNTTPGNFTTNNCVWTFSNGDTFIGCTGATGTFVAPGCYDVTLEVTSDEGCYGSSTVSSAICVEEDPIPGFYWQPAQPSLVDPTVTIFDISQGGISYSYTFDGQGSSTQQNPTHTFTGIEQETDVTVCQTVTSDAGCSATVCEDITIYEEIIFYVPNIFTPDGDLFNETFAPVFTSGIDIYDFHMIIFNRWGEIVFESYNKDAGWDGHYGEGGLVKDGTYIWQVDFGDKISDERHSHRGHVTVLK